MKFEIKNNFVNQKSLNSRMQRFQPNAEKKKFMRKIELFEKVSLNKTLFILKKSKITFSPTNLGTK